MNFPQAITALVLGVLIGSTLKAQDIAAHEGILRDYIHSRDPSTATRLQGRLLQSLSESELDSLRLHASHSVAIFAAWEARVQRQSGLGDDGLSTESLAWFIGFLEGRLRVEVPQEWSNILLRGERRAQGRVVFPADENAASPYKLGSGLVNATSGYDVVPARPVGIRVRSNSTMWSIECRDSRLELPAVSPAVSLLVEDGHVFIAEHGPWSEGFTLARIDTVGNDAAVRWCASGWGGTTFAFRGIPGFHWVILKRRGERLVVFGAANDSLYVEVYQADNGECRGRFSTGW